MAQNFVLRGVNNTHAAASQLDNNPIVRDSSACHNANECRQRKSRRNKTQREPGMVRGER